MPSSGTGRTPRNGEGELHLRDAVNLLRRNLWLILGIAATVIGATAWWTWTRPPVFEASTTILVEADRAGGAPQQIDFLSDMLGRGDVETEMALLRSRSIAAEAVDSLALQVQVVEPVSRPRVDLFAVVEASELTRAAVYTFIGQGDRYEITDADGAVVGIVGRGEPIVFNGMRLMLRPDSAGPDRAEQEPFPDRIVLRASTRRDAIRDLGESLGVGRPDRDATVMSVSYTGTDPVLVRDVPTLVARRYIAARSESKKTEANSTVEFLETQIAAYRVRLADAEDALLNYQQREQVVNLQAEGAEQVRRLVDAQARQDQLQSELQQLDAALGQIDTTRTIGADALRNPYQGLAAFPTFLQNQSVTELLSDLNEARAEYIGMSARRTPSYPDMQALEATIDELQAQLFRLAVNYREQLESELATAEAALTRFGQQLERIPDQEIQVARLERETASLEEVFSLLQSRLKEAEIAQAIEPGDVRIIDAAILPADPIRPRKFRSMVLAILFGSILGLGVAAAREYLDETVHSREDLIRVTNLPVLGMIPRIRGAGSNGRGILPRARAMGDRLVTRNDAGNPVSEAYRAFRTNITFLDLDTPARTLVFTSPGPADGKSTSASNLAIALAQQGSSTVLVDCDLRKGIVHRIFDAEEHPGVTDVLTGAVTIEEAIQQVEVGEGTPLHFIPTGTIPPNPSELIGSRQMRDFLELLAERFDKVLLDSPPLNLVTDAAVLGTMADGVILIARAGHTARGALRYAKDQLAAVRAPMSGVVLNDLDYQGRDRYYGSGAGYGYYYKYYGKDWERAKKG